MATQDEIEGDIFDRVTAALFSIAGMVKGCLRTLNAVRSRSGARGTDREAALLRLFAEELRRCAVLLDEAATKVNVVVHRK